MNVLLRSLTLVPTPHSNRLAPNYGDLTAKECVFKFWVKVLPMRGGEMHAHVRKFHYDRRLLTIMCQADLLTSDNSDMTVP